MASLGLPELACSSMERSAELGKTFTKRGGGACKVPEGGEAATSGTLSVKMKSREKFDGFLNSKTLPSALKNLVCPENVRQSTDFHSSVSPATKIWIFRGSMFAERRCVGVGCDSHTRSSSSASR